MSSRPQSSWELRSSQKDCTQEGSKKDADKTRKMQLPRFTSAKWRREATGWEGVVRKDMARICLSLIPAKVGNAPPMRKKLKGSSVSYR